MSLKNPKYPTIKASDLVFREKFTSHFDVARNGGVISGNPTIDNGYEGDGSGDYLTYDSVKWNQMNDFSIFMKGVRLDSLTSQALISSLTSTGILVRVISASSIQFFIDQNVSSVQRSHGLSIGQVFNFGVSYTESTKVVEMYIDGVSIGGGTLSQGLDRTTVNTMQLFARITANDSMDGACEEVIIGNRALSDQEHADLNDEATYSYANELTAHWPLHDKVGNPTYTTTDVLNGNNLTVNGATKTDHGYSFTTNDSLSASDDDSFDVTTRMTWASWVRLDDLAAVQPLLKKGSNYEIDVTTSGYLQFNTETADTTELVPGNLYFLCATLGGGKIRYYINGSLSSTVSGILALTANSDDLTIGTDGSNFLEGDLEGIYFDSANTLTATQIRDLYSKGPKYLGSK